MRRSLSKALPDKNSFKNWGLGNVDPQEVFDRLCKSFNIEAD
jgi:hypothetical protein